MIVIVRDLQRQRITFFRDLFKVLWTPWKVGKFFAFSRFIASISSEINRGDKIIHFQKLKKKGYDFGRENIKSNLFYPIFCIQSLAAYWHHLYPCYRQHPHHIVGITSAVQCNSLTVNKINSTTLLLQFLNLPTVSHSECQCSKINQVYDQERMLWIAYIRQALKNWLCRDISWIRAEGGSGIPKLN